MIYNWRLFFTHIFLILPTSNSSPCFSSPSSKTCLTSEAILQSTHHLSSVSVLRQQATIHLESPSHRCCSVLQRLNSVFSTVSLLDQEHALAPYFLKDLSNAQTFLWLSPSWHLPFPGKHYFPEQPSASSGKHLTSTSFTFQTLIQASSHTTGSCHTSVLDLTLDCGQKF